MNKVKIIITVFESLAIFVASSFLFLSSIQTQVFSAMTCPYFDGGIGDDDGLANGIITISNNRTLSAELASDFYGEYNCSQLDFVINNNSTLTLESKVNSNINWDDDFGVSLNVKSLTVDSGSSISANGKGYLGATTMRGIGNGPGGGNPNSANRGPGGGHGGMGAFSTGIGGSAYGSFMNPTMLGSGGGAGSHPPYGGGNGGGAINITATNSIINNGIISANGDIGQGVNCESSGGGSGGSVFLKSKDFYGNGQVLANGGNGNSSCGGVAGGGGGGRIAINFSESYDYSGSISVVGGINGGATKLSESGTAIIVNSSTNDLIIPAGKQNWKANPLLEASNHQFSNVVVKTGAEWILEGFYTNNNDGVGFVFLTNSFNLEENAIVTGDGLGFKGGFYRDLGLGPGGGGTVGASRGAGGGHGGVGGNSANGAGGPTYGSANNPILLGSGGGAGNSPGGNGGSAVKIDAKNDIVVNGTISMNGTIGLGSNYEAGGGGSGGSIYLSGKNIFGSGLIRANGGNGGSTNLFSGTGGGGRIALYHVNQNSFVGSVNVLPGTHGISGAPGTISTGGLPSAPFNMEQRQQDQQTTISVGNAVSSSTIYFFSSAIDGDSSDNLRLEVELKEIGEEFENVATSVGQAVEYLGSSIIVSTSATDLIDLKEYRWQARICDITNRCSQWTSFGDNNESEADFHVVLNQPPNNPIIPGSSIYINGQYSNDTTPTFLFSQSDSDTDNQVKYQIQINSTNDFSTRLVNYISLLGSQGTTSFTVGQNTNGGEYLSGSEGQTLPEGHYFWRIRTIDEYGAESNWVVAEGNPAFIINTTKPTNIVTTSMKAHAGHSVLHEDDSEVTWFGREDLYFSWQTSGDTSILKGYCVYLGLDEGGDPSSQKGLLGTSPIATTGSNCQFITDDIEIDFSNTALRGSPWLSSSNSPYYFKIRPIDMANNVGAEDTETSTFRFHFDSTPPNNVKTISASSGSMSSVADMNFYWPTSGTQYATDVGSGILGFQYAINSTDTWRGVETDPITGFAYIPPGYSQPFYLDPDVVGDDIIVGSNVLYFRTLDIAGNASNYTTAPLEYGGEAPAFPNNAKVTINPTTNTNNSFAFSWPEATPSDGRTIDKYYYMVNTPPPALFSTITSNSSVYVPTAIRDIEALSLPNARKGSNTIYVVAVDDKGNYSQSNYVSGNFTLNSTLPDPPQSIVVSDASVKSASLWRASLAWSKPDYTGTDNLKYVIQRSNDGNTWSNVSETSGLAFLDTLSASQKYYWRIGAFDTSDESMASPSYGNAVFLIPKGAYTEPAQLTSGPSASSITTKRATINWTTSRTSDSKISIGTESKKYEKVEPSDSTQTSEHSLALANLSPGTTYYYVAKWTDEDGNTGISEEKTFKTEPPPSVKDVEIKNVGIDSALIEFTTIGASSASINFGRSTEFGGIKTISTATNEATYSIQLSDLDDGTKYYFKIDTKDTEEDTYEGTILNFETLPRPEVSNVKVQQIANTAQSSILVSWESNTPISSIVTFYPESNPEYARDAVDIKLLEGEHEMVIPGLLPETPYILIVKGRDRLGNEAVSDRLRFTTATDTRPPKISDMVIEGSNVPQVSTTAQGSNSQLIVTWTTDEPATSQVEYGEGTGTTYSQITQEDQTLTYNHLVIVSGLTPSKVYHLRAISKDSAGNISRSVDTVTITPKSTDNAFDLVITNLKEAFGFLSRL